MPKIRFIHIAVIMLLVSSCSRTTLNLKKNSWAARTYHNTTSKYNIYFNGDESFKEGIQAIEDKNADDYSRVLPVFEDGIHENYAVASSNMEYAITKSNKIIQLHSIKKKPPYNPKKVKDPEYRKWRNQEEFNKMVDDAYMLMGKATFYKEQFLESIGVFNYVTLKYEGEDIWYLANLWIARAYIEAGWMYEAENILTLVNDDKLPYQYKQFYNIVSADYRIKMGEYPEAVPFLNDALEEHMPRHQKQRIKFILGQIHQGMGDNDLAYDYYKSVIRSFPPYEMELYARIRLTEVMTGDDVHNAIKKLNKMLKDPKNVEYKGQIYYALGNIYNTMNDRRSAIDNYRLSMAFSKDLQKGVTSKTIAELYWADRDYLGSQSYYKEAKENLTESYPNYQEISYRSDVTTELTSYYDVMGDTYREYRISQMSESEKREFLAKEKEAEKREKEIKELIDEANSDAEKEQEYADNKKTSSGNWYFYNEKLVESGKRQFEKQWGDRPLTDNWRRIVSDEINHIADAEEDNTTNDNETITQISQEDTASQYSQEEIAAMFAKEQEEKAASNKTIVDAYFNAAMNYQYDIEDYDKALELYEALEAQYPHSPHSPDNYFAIYNLSNELGNTQKAQETKQKLLSEYSESNYALILTDPNAQDILAQDRTKYNMLYEQTFALFVKGENYKVLSNTKQLKTEYRDSSLQAKILLMEALATAKTNPYADIRPQLENLSKNYAYDTEVKAQADNILSQLGKGEKIALGGSAANTLAERRNETAAIERQRILEKQQFKYEPESRHYMILVLVDSMNVNKNQLQYDVAKFNFNKFLTMDFDLSFVQFNMENTLMIINGFSNEEEGKWYRSEFNANGIINNYDGIKKMYIISEENFRLLLQLQTFEEYNSFDNKH